LTRKGKQKFGPFLGITAELGRALVVVGHPSSQWEQPIFAGPPIPPPKKKTIESIPGTNDYVGEGNPHAKFGNIKITGGFSPYK